MISFQWNGDLEVQAGCRPNNEEQVRGHVLHRKKNEWK